MTTIAAAPISQTVAKALRVSLHEKTSATSCVLVQAQIDWPGPAVAEARVRTGDSGDPRATHIESVALQIGTTLDDLVTDLERAGIVFRRHDDGRAAWRVIPDEAGPWLSLDVRSTSSP
jgi:hypothetical protein